ncbi:class I SAM-dependent methyltransferase [soil metagenome]
MANALDKQVVAYEGQSLYDFDNDILLNWYPARIMKLASGARSLLELGLGHGFTARMFEDRFDRHVVLEGSPAVIGNFAKNNPRCTADIVETYFENFETDEMFDLIVMGFILEHVDDPFQVISRFRKFLSPNGTMFLAVPNAEAMNRRVGHAAGLLSDMQELSGNDNALGHKRYYTVKTLTEEVERAGCAIERLEGIYLKPFTTRQIMSLNFDKKILDALCEVGVEYPELSCGILAQLK